MKRLLFCFLILSALFRPAHSFARDVKTAPHSVAVQTTIFSNQECLQKKCCDYLYSSLLEIMEDDTNDPDDEPLSAKENAVENGYLTSCYFFKSHFQSIRTTGYYFSQGSPFFILHKVFRI